MASITEPNADLAELAERLQSVAQALRSLPAGHPEFPEELEVRRREVMAVSAQLRRR